MAIFGIWLVSLRNMLPNYKFHVNKIVNSGNCGKMLCSPIWPTLFVFLCATNKQTNNLILTHRWILNRFRAIRTAWRTPERAQKWVPGHRQDSSPRRGTIPTIPCRPMGKHILPFNSINYLRKRRGKKVDPRIIINCPDLARWDGMMGNK